MDLENFFEEESEEKDISLDFRRYLRGIYKRKWIVIAIFLAVTIPWFFYLKSQPPEYEAFTWIRFKNYDVEQLRVLNESRYIELTSRTFAEKVVAQLGLTLELMKEDKEEGILRQDVFTQFYTNLKPVSGYYILSINDSKFTLSLVDEEENRQQISSGKISEITDQVYTVNGFSFQLKPSFLDFREEIQFRIKNFRLTVIWFQNSIRISMRQGGSLMQISMVHDNPQIVAQMVNKLAEIFLEESISFEKQKEKEYKNAVTNQLKLAEEQLRKHQEELKDFKETYLISLDTDVQKKVDRLSELENEKEAIEKNTKILADLLQKLDEIGSTTITPGEDNLDIPPVYNQIIKNELFVNDASFGILAQQLTDYETRRQRYLDNANVNPSYPAVMEIDKEIVKIQRQIYDFAVKKRNDSKNDVANINLQIANLQKEIRRLPSEQTKLANLTQKVEVSRRLYSDLLSKSQEVEISEAVDTQDIDILDPAIPPDRPMNRGKRKNAIIGALFAMFLSLGCAVFLEYHDKSIKSPDDIKKYLKLNVIGTIPKIEFENEYSLKDSDKLKQIDSQLVTYDYSPTPIGEAYRALRTKIVFSKQTGKIKMLVVTSFAPGDGKSFTSSNLAVTMAQHKSNTLLVDSDLRRGVLHNTFGVSKEPGFSNYLMGMAQFDDIINETYVPNLSIISCGSMMPNPSELLGSLQLKRFVKEAKSRYDMVIFDSPPLNAATDSVVLGSQSDGVVLIVRADVTNRNVAKQKLDLFENVPANLVGVILNGTETELAHDGYSYYHY